MRIKLHILPALLFSALAACVGGTVNDDPTMYITGTEELAVTSSSGQATCTNPKKVLICHIPPGNPANAHDICVSENAVATHQAQHGDTIGACAAQPPPTPPPDAGSGGGGGGGGGGSGGDIDAAIVVN
jgi:hypothetical protein